MICICACTILVWVRADLNIDDECVMDGTSVSGTCKIAHECSSAFDDLENGVEFTTCGYLHDREIICCPKPAPIRPPHRISRTSEFV